MFKIKLKLKTLILLTLIPFLLLIVLAYAFLTYFDLYRVILTGFDRKLYAVSTVAAAFIDGSEQKELTNMQQVRGLTFDSQTNTLYGNYYIDNRILAINVNTSKSTHLPEEIGFYGVEDIAFNTKDRFIYGVVWDADEEGNEVSRLIKINTATGKGTDIRLLAYLCHGLAYQPNENVLYCNNDEYLFRIDPRSGKEKIVGDIKVSGIRGLAYHTKKNTLYAAVTQTNELAIIDTVTGAAQRTVPLLNTKASSLLLGTFGLAFDVNTAKLYGSTTVPIVEINHKTGKSQAIAYSQDAGQLEREKMYQKYVLPMIRIKNKKDLTFLYSSVLINKATTISYVLDATQDEIHSYIGYEDPDAAEDNIRDVWLKEEVYLSDIKYWEEWGLLKSAYVPITNQKEEVTGYAGADVNISVIERKTKEILLKVLLTGFLSIILVVVVSIFISNRIIYSINNLKSGALQIAAGMFGSQITIQASKELQELTQTFNQMSVSLKNTVSKFGQDNQKILSDKLKGNLFSFLAKSFHFITPSQLDTDINLPSQEIWLNSAENIYSSPSGCISYQGKLIVWLVEPVGDTFEDLRNRSVIAFVLQRILGKFGEDELFVKIKDFLSKKVNCVVLYDLKSGRVDLSTQSLLHVLKLGTNAVVKDQLEIGPGEASFNVEAKESAIIAESKIINELKKDQQLPKKLKARNFEFTKAVPFFVRN